MLELEQVEADPARRGRWASEILGQIPEHGRMGVSHLLPRIVGLGHASELMLTGRLVGAEEAARIGLANRVVPAGALLDEAAALAGEIARNTPFAIRMTKQVLGVNVDAQSLAAAIELENRTQILATQTGDFREAIMAFVEKREPRYDSE